MDLSGKGAAVLQAAFTALAFRMINAKV